MTRSEPILRCASCGLPVDKQDRFCRHCGQAGPLSVLYGATSVTVAAPGIRDEAIKRADADREVGTNATVNVAAGVDAALSVIRERALLEEE